MQHQNSVFHQIQRHIPWETFDRLVEDHKADHRVRRLPSKSQFLALLFGQLSGAMSLREIEAAMSSHQNQLYHVGAKLPARSTLADANAKRPWQLFADLFANMAQAASARTRRHLSDAVRIIDATHIRLSSFSSDWLSERKGLWAAKMHLVYDPNADTPMQIALTDQTVADVTPAKAFEPVPGMTYVFDLAYYDFAWWAKLNELGCRIVTRFKSNTPLRVSAVNKVPKTGSVLTDCIGLLPERLAWSRKNPMSDPVREVTVRISTGKILRILTNDLDAPAQEIADLYKQRWQIELFFKWAKQNLRIRHFLGTSENAIRIQIFVALVAYILIRMAQAAQSEVSRLLTFTRLVRVNIMHRRSICHLKTPPKPPAIDPRQMALPGLAI